ncbi:hypothetical protein [Nocardioides deserti]|uniref:Uncharacterized protein n=1 Tax=Nocardioides deserti TaxID=1588644 RepID=A0ABR6U4Z1_9ACTN|nr:hypothetical protein [Nocardioides deserti]MBC2959380.1 hypothetical protein [Nocardioides deserti]GGO73333.1 hypothetical protein GCM10012276_18660 [Nocardioides deserti]
MALIAGVLLVPPAGAAPQGFDFSVVGPNGGGGRAYGNVDFTGKRSFTFDLRVVDQCNSAGNGDGLEVEVYFAMTTPSNATRVTEIKGWDRSGCGDGIPGPFSGTVSRDHDIKDLRVVIQLVHPSGAAAGYSTPSGFKNNPFV